MRLIACLLLLFALAAPAARASQPITVFGAASLTDALSQIGKLYSDQTGARLRFSFAASSALARQVEAGAPADVVALASTAWADYLEKRGLLVAGTRISPIGNRLAVIAPSDSTAKLSLPLTAAQVGKALGPDGRLAVGDPAHVPAGIYAKESLKSLGLWQDLKPHLAIANDVRAALALVERGETPLGIVYTTDARVSKKVKVLLHLPDDSHEKIAYAFAAVKGGHTGAAEKFLKFLAGPEARAVFARDGFAVD